MIIYLNLFWLFNFETIEYFYNYYIYNIYKLTNIA